MVFVMNTVCSIKIENGQQVERPDDWLEKGAPWEFMRPSKRFSIDFGGHIYFEDKNVSGIRLKSDRTCIRSNDPRL